MRCRWIAPLILLTLAVAHAEDTRGQGVEAVLGAAPDLPNYHAIVIGINDYQDSDFDDLRQARPDAEKVAATLHDDYGFSVRSLYDRQATKEAIIGELQWAQNELGRHDALLIFFSGHGNYDPRLDEGYWIPTDARHRTAQGYPDTNSWVMNTVLKKYVGAMEARAVLVVSDSCFSGALFRAGATDLGKKENTWYRRALAVPSRYAISSGSLETVPDKSVFATKFLQCLEYPDRSVFSASDVAISLKNEVAQFTDRAPRFGPLDDLKDHRDGEFVFVRRKVLAPAAKPATPVLEPGPAIRDTGSIELVCRLAGSLFVDGKTIGRVEAGRRYTLRDIDVGRRQLRITGPEGDWTGAVMVRRDQTARVETEPPAPPKPTDPTAGNVLGMAFVEVSPGSFRMGSTDGEIDEQPVHEVRITKPYWIGKYEVTNGQYQAFLQGSGYDGKNDADGDYLKHLRGQSDMPTGDDYPICWVSWKNAVAFCKWLTERERAAGRLPAGYEYRLPTEAEWEYAARGGAQSRGFTYSGSNTLGDVGWYGDNGGGKTHEVGGKHPNELGIYDMSGNVWERCHDWHGDYPSGLATDPKGPGTGSCRVLRGGSWNGDAGNCRVAIRNGCGPAGTLSYLGFRAALGPSQ